MLDLMCYGLSVFCVAWFSCWIFFNNPRSNTSTEIVKRWWETTPREIRLRRFWLSTLKSTSKFWLRFISSQVGHDVGVGVPALEGYLFIYIYCKYLRCIYQRIPRSLNRYFKQGNLKYCLKNLYRNTLLQCLTFRRSWFN